MDQNNTDTSALQAALERQETTIALLEQRINQLEALVRASGPMATETAINKPAKAGRTADRIGLPATEHPFSMYRMVHDGYTYSDLDIKDPELIHLLKDVIVSYPGISFDLGTVYMQSPFPSILQNAADHVGDGLSQARLKAGRDLAHLLNQISTCKELFGYFVTREAHLAAGVTTFETAWTLFAPGTLIVTKPFMDVPQLLEIAEAPVPWARTPAKNANRLHTSAWCWDWNGRRMVKVKYKLIMRRFTGTKAVNQLEYYPVTYHKDMEVGALLEMILKRSSKFLMATLYCKSGGSQRYQYIGQAYEYDDSRDHRNAFEAKFFQISSEIMCDAQSYIEYANSKSSHAIGDMDHDSVETVGESEDPFANLSPGEVGRVAYRDHKHILLLPGRLLGYAMREKLWGQFSVELAKPPLEKCPRAFLDRLQLEDRYKVLIQALFATHEARQGRNVQDADFVHELGRASVILLHGPSGVGKTLTAETIALATGKPLFTVSVTEIRLHPSRAGSNIGKLFGLATRWEAVFLVNEADVLLEPRRSTADTSRHAPTSVFLNALDNYNGIIILTTDRVKIWVDEAIISRIDIAVPYYHLADVQTQAIFKYFLDQVDPGMIEDRPLIDEFIHDTGHLYGLNGREIRNVAFLAIALARQEAAVGRGDGRVSQAHIRKLCQMKRETRERLSDRPLAQRYNDGAIIAYKS
ncbi:hypothetical protein DL769_011530 [Monosporascus sp. CRB-8-3]|nr:hypothetical protein DL769_011530 [Monosporascus sp. CRB-8-3]